MDETTAPNCLTKIYPPKGLILYPYNSLGREHRGLGTQKEIR